MICIITGIVLIIGLLILSKELTGHDKYVAYTLIVTLAVVCFLMYNRQIRQQKTISEGFDGTSDIDFESLKSIVSYLKGVSPSDATQPENEKLLSDLQNKFGNFDPQKLEDQMNQINNLLSNLQNISGLIRDPEQTVTAGDETSILETRNIRESQLMQDMEIKSLEEDLAKLQTLYKNVSDAKVQREYKKIPVYSSCVMEADGSMSRTDAAEKVVVAEESTTDTDTVEKIIQDIAKGGISISLTGK